jgi:hypothetical protein
LADFLHSRQLLHDFEGFFQLGITAGIVIESGPAQARAQALKRSLSAAERNGSNTVYKVEFSG